MNKLINLASLRSLLFAIAALCVVAVITLSIDAYLHPIDLFNYLGRFTKIIIYSLSLGVIGGVASSYIYFTMIKNK